MADVLLSGVTKRFDAITAVDRMDLAVSDGEFVVLLGPTGAGKTTTLRLVAGLEKPDEGEIFIAGQDMTAAAPTVRDVSFVFQQYSLYPHLKVYDNLAFPLRSPARRVPEEAIRKRVTETAEMLHIEHKLENKATELSGGEMQRVAIGRALVRAPQIYLMDEPLSSLDAKLRAEMRIELKRIQKELGATLLYVTHDQIEAMTMANRIGVIDHGRLIQVGPPREIYENPHNVYVATRLGQPAINLIPHDLIPAGILPAGTATIGARTEHIRIKKSTNGAAQGTVQWIEHLGDQNHLHLTVGDLKITTLVEPDTDLAVDDRVSLELINPLYFDGAGERLKADA